MKMIPLFLLACVLAPSAAAVDGPVQQNPEVVKAKATETVEGDEGFGETDTDAFGNVKEDALGNAKALQNATRQAKELIRSGQPAEQVIAKIVAQMPPGDREVAGVALRSSLDSFLKQSNQGSLEPQKPGVPNTNLSGSLLSGLDRNAIQRNPDRPGPYVDSGRDHFRLGRFRDSYGDYSHAFQLGDQSPAVMIGMAGSALKLGDYATAAAAARKALETDPGNQEAMFLLHDAKDRAPVMRLPSPFSSQGGSQIADGAGSPEPGPAAAAAAPAGFAGAPPPSGMTAAEVARLAQQAAAAGPDAAVRSGQFTKDAASAMRVRDYSTAYTLATQAISLNPQNAQALNFRAMSLSQMRRYSDAVQDASAALGLAPGSAAALQTRSWAFAKQGKYKESLVDAQATLEHDPNNAYAYQNLAFARAGLGDREGALEALKQSADLDPRFKGRLERAVQAPQDADLTLLFDDGSAAPAATAAAPAPGTTRRKFLRLAVMTASGGLLIALGVLHIVSASWREKMRLTVRRVLGPSPVAAGSAVASAPEGPGMGAFWTQYELVKEIGLGGMGVVYEATDRSLERRVAVKKMRDEIRLDPADRARFVAEARMVAQLHHPSIVDIYGIVEDGNEVYLVFEFVDGRTLQDALKSGGPMDVARAAKVLRDMASAVTHAHEKGIIHRDLKPSNVMITTEGRVKVMDFGIARQAKDVMTRHSMTNTIAGTPPYMAPEQEQGTVRRESDVYALGVCLYEMTTGHLPFTGTGAAMLLNKLNGKLIAPSARAAHLPPGLDAVIAKALAPDPDKRYRTPAELTAALDALTSVDLAS